MQTGDDVRRVVAEIAATPMQMSLMDWQEVSSVLLQAADELDRLRQLLARADAVSTWETTAEGRSFQDEIDQALNR